MTRQDPQKAAAWVLEMPPGESQDYAYGNLVDAWSRYDLAGAQRWIAHFEPGRGRQLATEAFIRSNAVRAGDRAWDLANQSSDSDRLLAMQSLVMEGWAQQDPAAAREALKALDRVPDEVQKQFDKSLEVRNAWQELFSDP